MANLKTISTLIEEKGFTKSEFAKKIGLSYTGFLKILKVNSTNIETLEKIARELRVSVSTFFDEVPQSMVEEPAGIYRVNPESMKLRDTIIELQKEIIRLQGEIIRLQSANEPWP